MNFLHANVSVARAGTTVRVSLTRPGANVMLLDDRNYRRYERGERFEYHGGYVKETTVDIPVPHVGAWHLVVDLGGALGTIGANYSVI